MARYFFNTYDGDRLTFDDVGEDLPSGAAAWETGTRFASECLRDLAGELERLSEWRLEVVREDGMPIFRISLQAESAVREVK